MDARMGLMLLGFIVASAVYCEVVKGSPEEVKVMATDLPESEENYRSYVGLDEPVIPDDDDMEAAEVLVFRPLFSYRRVQAERRRKARQYDRRSPYYYR